MQDQRQQLIEELLDELLQKILAEEAQARVCAHHAALMFDHGNAGSANAVRQMGLRHTTEGMELRTRLAALHTPDSASANEPSLNVFRLRHEERQAITFDQLLVILAGLPLGDVVLLSEAQFQWAFAQHADPEANRQAAIALAEEHGCRLMFRMGLDPYVVFTRRQRLSEVVLSNRTCIAA